MILRDLIVEKLGVPLEEMENSGFALMTVKHRHSYIYAGRNQDICVKCTCLVKHRHRYNEIRTEKDDRKVTTYSKCDCGAHLMKVRPRSDDE